MNYHHKPTCIQYISTYLPITEYWIYNLLSNMEFYTPLILSRNTTNLSQFSIGNIVSLSQVNLPTRLFNYSYFKLSGYFPIFKESAIDQKAQIIHAHFGYHGIKTIRLKQKMKIPLICSFYGNDVYKWTNSVKYRRGLKRLFQEADLMLVLGPYMKGALISLGCPQRKILIQHLGVNVQDNNFIPKDLNMSEPIPFLMACSFVEKKGVDIVIKALDIIKKEVDFKLNLIGDGPLKDKIIQLIHQYNLGKNIYMYGYQPYSKLMDLASRCQVFLQASKTASNGDKEGTPMSLVDVMAVGMPVISTRHSDIPEIVLDGETGYLVEENDPHSFAQAILTLIKDQKRYNIMSNNSHNHILNNFNIRTQAQKLENIYMKLITKE